MAADGTPDDRALASAFLERRDEAAFRTLFRRHTPGLLAFVQRFLGRAAAQAEDVVQETWLRAARALPGFEWRSSLHTWLIGIAIRSARESQRREPPAAEELAESHAVVRPVAVQRDLERALRSLADGYREVLLLHDLYGYTHAEIAERLDIEVGTSKSQLSRARQVLRERWPVIQRSGAQP